MTTVLTYDYCKSYDYELLKITQNVLNIKINTFYRMLFIRIFFIEFFSLEISSQKLFYQKFLYHQ